MKCYPTLLLASLVAADRRPPSGGPWKAKLTTICAGDRDRCCPKDVCADELMAANAATCLREAPYYCPFEVKAVGTQWYMDDKDQFHFGCTADDYPTVYVSLPYNVMNGKDFWELLTVEMWPFNFNNTENCLTTDWIGQIVRWPPTKCERMDPTAEDVHRFTYEEVRFFNVKRGPAAKQSHHQNNRLIWFNATKLLSDRRYGDHVGLRIEPVIGSKCTLFHNYVEIKDSHRPRPASYWHSEAAAYRVYAEGTLFGQKDDDTPLTPPADLTVPGFMKFRNGTKVEPIIDPEYAPQTTNTAAPVISIAERGLKNLSSCDEAVLRTQLEDIRDGVIELNPDCDWENLYENIFGKKVGG